MIVDPGSKVCVDFAARTRGIAVGFTGRWSTQKPVSTKPGEVQGLPETRTLAGVGWNELE